MEERTVSEKLDKLIDNFENMKEDKKFKLPLSVRMKKGKIRKKNHAVVQIIRTNGSVEFKMLPIEDNTIKIGDTYHEATAKYVMRYKQYPMIIVPEWNITPLDNPTGTNVFHPEKNLEEAIGNGKLSAAEKFILHAIKMDLVKGKSKMNATTVIIVIAAIIGILILLSYMKVI